MNTGLIKYVLKLAYLEYCKSYRKQLDVELIDADIDMIYKLLHEGVIYPINNENPKQVITNAERLLQLGLVTKEKAPRGFIKYRRISQGVSNLLNNASEIAKIFGLEKEFDAFRSNIITTIEHPLTFFIRYPKDLLELLLFIKTTAAKTGWFSWIFAESKLYELLKKDYVEWCKNVNALKIWDIGVLNISKEEFEKIAININEIGDSTTIPKGKSIITLDNYCYAFYKKSKFEESPEFPAIGRFLYGSDDINIFGVAFVNYDPLIGGVINDQDKYARYIERFKIIFDSIDSKYIIFCENGKIDTNREKLSIYEDFNKLLTYIKSLRQ